MSSYLPPQGGASYLLKLSDRLRQVQHVVASLEEGIHPRKHGVVLHAPGVGGALHGGLGLVVEVGPLEFA